MKRKYRPFTQLPYCCVPATLQWVLYRRGLDILDQETIGTDLGLRIPEKFSKYFQNKKIEIIGDDSKEFGTQILEKQYSINNFFIKQKIPLKISDSYYFDDESNLKRFLISHLKGDCDIILRYNKKVFDKEKSVGHFSLVAGYNQKTEIVVIGDPEPPFFKELSLEDLLFSISDKIDGIKRGIYLIE